jgi:uncharacterized lipoprotein YehR (DUF1307 family)
MEKESRMRLLISLIFVLLLVGCTSQKERLGQLDVTLIGAEKTLTSMVVNKQITPQHAEELLPYLDAVRAAKKVWVNAILVNDDKAGKVAMQAAFEALVAYQTKLEQLKGK